MKYVRRHYQRDGFYHYSMPVRRNNAKDFLFHTESGEEWVKWFEANRRHYLEDDYWLAPKCLNKAYTGAAEDEEIHHQLFIPKERIADLPIPETSKYNMGNPDDCDGYQIRYYKLGQRIFPLGLKTFRVSFCQYAVNYPPLTARYLYERYTEHIKDQDVINIYDPSMGWQLRTIVTFTTSVPILTPITTCQTAAPSMPISLISIIHAQVEQTPYFHIRTHMIYFNVGRK